MSLRSIGEIQLDVACGWSNKKNKKKKKWTKSKQRHRLETYQQQEKKNNKSQCFVCCASASHGIQALNKRKINLIGSINSVIEIQKITAINKVFSPGFEFKTECRRAFSPRSRLKNLKFSSRGL